MTRRTGSESREPVVVVTGPTASGKSGLAVQLAVRFGGEVVNADSMQVYRFMNIGTAKPSLEERGRVAHHLFDVVAPDVEYSAGRYVQEARAAAEDIHRRGKVVFLTGGTGLYIRTFLEGLAEVGGGSQRTSAAPGSDHEAVSSRRDRGDARAVREGDGEEPEPL